MSEISRSREERNRFPGRCWREQMPSRTRRKGLRVLFAPARHLLPLRLAETVRKLLPSCRPGAGGMLGTARATTERGLSERGQPREQEGGPTIAIWPLEPAEPATAWSSDCTRSEPTLCFCLRLFELDFSHLQQGLNQFRKRRSYVRKKRK